MATDFSKYNIHSDYDTDEVILCNEINLTQQYSGYWAGTLSHSLGFKPLAFAMIMLNNDGLWLSAGNTTATDALGMVVVSYSNRVEIHATTPLGQTVTSVKARIFALLPSDQQNANIPAPTSFGKYNINSDYNYDNLIAQGIATITNQSGSAQLIYQHNLGYLPRVMIWQEEVGGDNIRLLEPAYSAQSQTGLPTTIEVRAVQLTENDISMWYYSQNSMPDLKLHYRIYGSNFR